MNLNWLVIPVILLAIIFFWLGKYFESKFFLHKKIYFTGLLIFTLLSIPAWLYSVYYFHIFDDSIWFYKLRSLYLSELLAAGLGGFIGFFYALNKRKIFLSNFFSYLLVLVGLTWLLIPYIKPVIFPLHFPATKAQWKEGVALQSTASSCGAASTATLLKMLGHTSSEREIARKAYTSATGTENWYLARLIKTKGFQVNYFISATPPDKLYYPAMAGVILDGGVGHFISILGETDTAYIIGDPLVGKLFLDKKHFNRAYHFTGFFMLITL